MNKLLALLSFTSFLNLTAYNALLFAALFSSSLFCIDGDIFLEMLPATIRTNRCDEKNFKRKEKFRCAEIREWSCKWHKSNLDKAIDAYASGKKKSFDLEEAQLLICLNAHRCGPQS